jgi:hypothetical protein
MDICGFWIIQINRLLLCDNVLVCGSNGFPLMVLGLWPRWCNSGSKRHDRGSFSSRMVGCSMEIQKWHIGNGR